MVTFILNEDHEPIEVDSSDDRYQTFLNDFSKRIVEKTTIGEYQISTMFLGRNHAILGKPVLFETMVFKMPEFESAFADEKIQERYCTWNEAVEGHKKIVELVKARCQA